MLGSNTRLKIVRAKVDSYKQNTYGAPHLTGIEAYREPSSTEVVLTNEGPVGQLFTFYIDPPLKVPTQIQIADLLIDLDDRRYIIDGIDEYENHLVVKTSHYEAPDFTT